MRHHDSFPLPSPSRFVSLAARPERRSVHFPSARESSASWRRQRQRENKGSDDTIINDAAGPRPKINPTLPHSSFVAYVLGPSLSSSPLRLGSGLTCGRVYASVPGFCVTASSATASSFQQSPGILTRSTRVSNRLRPSRATTFSLQSSSRDKIDITNCAAWFPSLPRFFASLEALQSRGTEAPPQHRATSPPPRHSICAVIATSGSNLPDGQLDLPLLSQEPGGTCSRFFLPTPASRRTLSDPRFREGICPMVD